MIVAPVRPRVSSITSESAFGLAARTSVGLAPGLRGERPLVQLLAARSERLLERLVRPGDEAVERHRDVQDQLSHRASFVSKSSRLTSPRDRSHRCWVELALRGSSRDHPCMSTRMLLTAAVAVLVLVPGSSARVLANTWNGTWDTEWGAMALAQLGQRQGHLPARLRSYRRDVDRKQVDGSLDRAAQRRKGPSDAGAVELTMSANGKKLTGRWTYDSAPTSWHTDWNGNCSAGACLRKRPLPALAVAEAAAVAEVEEAGDNHNRLRQHGCPADGRGTGAVLVNGVTSPRARSRSERPSTSRRARSSS